MLWVFKQLCAPCNYLRIRHGSGILASKAVYDFVLPALLTGLTVVVTLALDMRLSVFHNDKFFSSLSGLLSILIGFYMAALAAVATFDRAGIDNRLAGTDAKLRVRDPNGGEVKDKLLSYRQFISYLFGYASFLSFVIYACLLLLGSAWKRLEAVLASKPAVGWLMPDVLDPVSFVVIFFFLWQLFVTSLLGIYFLAERIQELHETKT
ncbi:hypothetical protein [Brevundimonas sp. Root1423]|uniref:hypothetical protein n=1 Tax=Brevundimonas sp. Root1423 TaxID=1736462 RepID=UPI000A7545BE|nr:hypothetical protein [Brevundimonas sp. Root1423]